VKLLETWKVPRRQKKMLLEHEFSSDKGKVTGKWEKWQE